MAAYLSSSCKSVQAVHKDYDQSLDNGAYYRFHIVYANKLNILLA